VWIGQAKKPEQAAPILERVLEFDPANREAYEHVLSLYSTAGDWRAYSQAVDRYLPNLVTDDDKIKALRELGRIREQKLGQKDAAFLAMCRALQLDASDDSLREDVERLAQETGSYEELAAVYEQVAEDLPRGPLAERMYLVLARVQDRNLDDPEEAEAALRKILEFDPTNAPPSTRWPRCSAAAGATASSSSRWSTRSRPRRPSRRGRPSSGRSPASTWSG
jgi:tetratricopeptide (TPR) repeat protein